MILSYETLKDNPDKGEFTMNGNPEYPENRLDIRVDEQGNVTFEQNREFAKYYAPTLSEKEEELEELRHRLDLLEIDEPEELYSSEHDDWEEERRLLEEEIEDLEDEIEEMRP